MRIEFLAVAIALALLLPQPAAAQMDNDFYLGGAVRVGPSTTVCGAGNPTSEGAIRYNTTDKVMEFCNGTSWTKYAQVQGSNPPTAPSGSGYFVLSKSQWDGNVGGTSGANAKCLSDLTTNTDWLGYSDANSRGLLVASKVKAFFCVDPFIACENPLPLTTYYFANADNASAGGASFTADADSRGPANTKSWAAANYFGGGYKYWQNRSTQSSNNWNPFGYFGSPSCSQGTTNSSGTTGLAGNSSGTGDQRWLAGAETCDKTLHLICMVHP